MSIFYGRLQNRRTTHILTKGEPVCGSAMRGHPYIAVSAAEHALYGCGRCKKYHSFYAKVYG